MFTNEDATAIREWSEEARRMKEVTKERDNAIRAGLERGASVAELVKLTGMTRARIYQIRDRR